MGEREPYEENAVVISTQLGLEDHGILTFWLFLEFGDGTQQGFGGYQMTEDDTLAYCVQRILKVAGVQQWEMLPGRYLRVLRDGVKAHAICNIMKGGRAKDDWFEPATELANR